MSVTGQCLDYRQLRAPREHGRALIQPPWDAVEEVLQSNRGLLGFGSGSGFESESASASCQHDLHGRSLGELAAAARRDLLHRALQYTRAYRNVVQPASGERDVPVFIAGHQPQLFHPGVWFKTFVMDRLAWQHGGVAVNLLIDNDVLRSPSIRIPAGAAGDPRIETVAFDRPSTEIPFEERRLIDRGLFDSFGRRVEQAVGHLVADPLIEQFWPLALAASRDTDRLGRCLAQARHQLEARWGLETLELPLSQVCETDSFRWFVAHLLVQLPHFQDVYNRSLDEHRRQNGIRSRTHPVPGLVTEEDWWEAPFWTWSRDDPRRRRLFARLQPASIELSDRTQILGRLPIAADGNVESAVVELARLARRGIKVRPRALITTMYARLFLGDLFLHGIGGAKYDQLTDVLIQRGLGLAPPVFLAVTATLKLPIPRPQVTAADLRQVNRALRELDYHPERHLDSVAQTDGSGDTGRWIRQKREWIARQLPRGQRLERHRRISQANEALRQLLKHQRETLESERSRLAVLLRQEAILGSREYAFCLFPEPILRTALLELLPKDL